MPLYDYDCAACGEFIEDHFSASKPDTCEQCGQPIAVPPQLTCTVGIIWANQEDSKQLGVRFESNAQKREFFKQNPQLREMSKGSADDRRFGDRLRERAERKAKRLGYVDLEDKRRFDQRNRTKGLTTEQAIK